MQTVGVVLCLLVTVLALQNCQAGTVWGQATVGGNYCPESALATKGAWYSEVYKNKYCFVVFINEEYYPEAEKTCKSLGGNLAMPKTFDINLYLRDTFSKASVCTPAWIGMDDRKSEGNYVFADGTPVTYKNFELPRFNPGLEAVQDCVALDNEKATWVVDRCTKALMGVKRPFVCQFDVQSRRYG